MVGFRMLTFSAIAVAGAACATLSPRSRIEQELISLGLGEPRAECIADELADDLDRDDLKDIAEFLDDFGRAGSAGGAVDALLRIENPRAAAAAAGAGIVCALG